MSHCRPVRRCQGNLCAPTRTSPRRNRCFPNPPRGRSPTRCRTPLGVCPQLTCLRPTVFPRCGWLCQDCGGWTPREVSRERQTRLALMARVSESLAGRASYLTLWPMTRREQRGFGRTGCWDDLLAADDRDWQDVLIGQPAFRDDWRTVARRGGFPDPAVHLANEDERAIWFDGYIQTYLERDLATLSSVASLVDFRRLVRAACLRVGQVVNQTEMGRDAAIPQPTVHRYLTC